MSIVVVVFNDLYFVFTFPHFCHFPPVAVAISAVLVVATLLLFLVFVSGLCLASTSPFTC